VRWLFTSHNLLLSPPPVCRALASRARALAPLVQPTPDGRVTLLGPSRPGALHVLCVAGFVTREAYSPQTTFYPCRRRRRQTPNPLCAL